MSEILMKAMLGRGRTKNSVLEWNANGLAAGIYVVAAKVGGDVLREKVLLLR